MATQLVVPNPTGAAFDLPWYRRDAINRNGCLDNIRVRASKCKCVQIRVNKSTSAPMSWPLFIIDSTSSSCAH
jgi:hypothetical protein